MSRQTRKPTPDEARELERALPSLIESGLANGDGTLTDAGRLRLHQLECADYWFRVAVPRRDAARAERERVKLQRREERKKERRTDDDRQRDG